MNNIDELVHKISIDKDMTTDEAVALVLLVKKAYRGDKVNIGNGYYLISEENKETGDINIQVKCAFHDENGRRFSSIVASNNDETFTYLKNIYIKLQRINERNKNIK